MTKQRSVHLYLQLLCCLHVSILIYPQFLWFLKCFALKTCLELCHERNLRHKRLLLVCAWLWQDRPVCHEYVATLHTGWLLTSLSATKWHHFLCGSYLGTSFGCDELRERDSQDSLHSSQVLCSDWSLSGCSRLTMYGPQLLKICVRHNWENLSRDTVHLWRERL